MQSAFSHFLQQHGADQATIDQALADATLLELPTRHILLHQGEPVEHAFFLVDGICHACYLTENGRQFSKEFYWEQEMLIGFESLTNDAPSPFLLETLSASQLVAIPLSVIKQWRAQHHPLYQHLLERQLQFKEHKERFMLLHSPEERFALFGEHFPELCQRITDQQLASYLGITATSLSRIRKRLAHDDDNR
ncbi:Crp/Fnr family transcriptional regulator [Photobacterium aphoticum]|uniref:Crp/Fnr family transcriptional regulator n=1 Tax=Photobacterium aphoticum TaxID=754436 RepID=A0A0J1GJ76_9GAMM|nr:Crp/Fnr family transcriptional regulator [Photobacterium aphoticum]KLU99752.1 Crp/Fnr family transcriptional regulator [Photobacterium aphoticum]PSU46554.1 Crp/Fnr family transcriptional regulator [Photobacterium aphoticum]GHA66715.1 Crp/Fnr family transcriptional regulator [Photobacterium aphoticum]